MLISDKEKLIRLEERFQYDLKKYIDYTIALNIDENDYSSEYLLIKLIYSFNCYERAAENIKIDFIQSNLKLYKIEIESCISESDEVRNAEFVKDYFSISRLKSNLLDLEKKIVENREDDKNIDIATTYCSIIDNAKLLNDKYPKCSWVKHIDQGALTILFENNIYLFSYYADTIKNLRNLNMIPINKANSWWYQIKPLDDKRIGKIFEQFSIKMNQNVFISDILIESAGLGIEKFQKIQKDLANAIDWGRNQVPDFDDLILGFMNEPKTIPAYKTWSDEDTKQDSDYEFSMETFKKVNPFKDEIIKALIDLVDNDQQQVDSKKRKEVLAVAYLMLGRSQKAVEILDD